LIRAVFEMFLSYLNMGGSDVDNNVYAAPMKASLQKIIDHESLNMK